MVAPRRKLPLQQAEDSKPTGLYTQLLNSSETLVSQCPTDLSLEGWYTEGAVLLTDERLITVKREGDTPIILLELPRDQIRELHVRHMYGNGILEAEPRENHPGGTVFPHPRQGRGCAGLEIQTYWTGGKQPRGSANTSSEQEE